MGKWAGRLIGGGIGWAFFGPLGALFGAYIGGLLGEDQPQQFPYGQPGAARFGSTQAGDFAVALLSLFAHVSKADRRILSSEVSYVKQWLIQKFGRDNAQDLLYLYKEILQKDYNIHEVSRQIRNSMDYYGRLELMHVLFGIAGSNGKFDPAELRAIREIAGGLGIADSDYQSIKSIFIGDTHKAYGILNVRPDSATETIKKAYRELAVKYHPDKVSHLGPDIQKTAEEKFKAINDAYQTIRKERGF